MEAKKSIMGRPKKEDYRKKTMRYSRVEDSFKEVLHKIDSDIHRKVILEVLEKLKA